MSKIVNVSKVLVPAVKFKAPDHGEICKDGHHFQVSSLKQVKVKGGLRDAFIPPEGYVWLAADYAAEEMRLMANFSQEPHLVEPLLAGEDIHTYIAKQMFGFSDPAHRTRVKVLNFATAYGATGSTISRKLSISKQDADNLIDKYYKTLSRLKLWKEEQCRLGRRKGMVFTLFGRPRLVYKYYNSSDSGMQGFADRTCTNSPVQGCVPLNSYFPLKDKVVLLKNLLGTRSETLTSPVVCQHRGESDPIFCYFNTGDFLVCDSNHSLIARNSSDDLISVSIRDSFKIESTLASVLLSPLRSKSKPTLKVFSLSIESALQVLTGLIRRGDTILPDNSLLNDSLWRLWFSGSWFPLPYEVYSSVRTVAELFGFNVVYSLKKDKFKITFRRHSTAKFSGYKYCFSSPTLVSVGTCSVMQGYEKYSYSGFYNKNTGGDLIRLDLIKLQHLFEQDKEFAANVRSSCTIHDEIDLYVKPTYLRQAFIKLRDLMYFKIPQFSVPIIAEPSVGSSWGTLIDCDDISEDNKLIIREFEPSVEVYEKSHKD